MRRFSKLLFNLLVAAALAVGGVWVLSRGLMTGEFHTRQRHVIDRSADAIAYWLYVGLLGFGLLSFARWALASFSALVQIRAGGQATGAPRRRREILKAPASAPPAS